MDVVEDSCPVDSAYLRNRAGASRVGIYVRSDVIDNFVDNSPAICS